METQTNQPSEQTPEQTPEQEEIAPIAEVTPAGEAQAPAEPTAPDVEAPPEPQPQSQAVQADALERLLAEAEARGYERGCQDAMERLSANPPMWQPVDPSPSRFLSGLRGPVWPRD